MSLSSQEKRISRLLSDKLLPWAISSRALWITVTDRRNKLKLCDGVQVFPRRMKGGEVSGGARRYGNSPITTRRWPQDHLHACKLPKLACVISGYADLQFYDYELRVPESTFLFIPPNVPEPDGSLSHINKGNPLGVCEVLWMRPLGDELHFWICRSENDAHSAQQWSNILFLNPRINSYFQLLYEETTADDDTPVSLRTNLLELLITGLQREIYRGNYLSFGQDKHPRLQFKPASDSITRAQNYIDAHYGSAITLESLSRMVGVSRSLLAQRFKETTGKTVGEYLTQRRLQKAKELLCQSDWTVAMISEFIGFRSQNYFYSLFQQREGCSPVQFRDAYRNHPEKEIYTIT